VNRRIVLAAVAVLALLGARLSMSHAAHFASTTRTSVDRAASPAAALATAPEPSPLADANRSPEPAPEPAQPTTSSSPESSPSSPATPQVALAVADYDPHKTFGSKSAPITMEVFSDFQCPACKTLYTTTNRQLMDNYVTVGKVFLIHRDFPLNIHAYSRVAARYSRAAAQIGKIEAVEQTLFQNQEKWEQTGDVDGTVAAVLSASEMAKVRALVKGGTLDPGIDRDFALGTNNYHINQTPTTIIHSKGQTYPVVGVVNFDVLKNFLDQLLSQK
jgi:protein-disulfide isomerase